MQRLLSRQSNRRPILVAAALTILFALPGCAELPASAKQQKLDAEIAYRERNFSKAETTLTDFLSHYPDHVESADAYYLRALCHAEQSHKYLAVTDARNCIRLAQDSELAAKAHAMAGALMFEQGKFNEAASHFASALPGMPEAPPTDLVRYRYGLSLQRIGDWQKARLEFAAVFQRYPGSDLAQHARRMYDWPHNCFVIQCGAFRDAGGAEELKNKLVSRGLSATVERGSRSGESLYVVYVGRYPQYDQAEASLSAVRRQVPDALIKP